MVLVTGFEPVSNRVKGGGPGPLDETSMKIRVQSERIRTFPARPYRLLADCKSGLWAFGAGVRSHDTSTYPSAVLQAAEGPQLVGTGLTAWCTKWSY